MIILDDLDSELNSLPYPVVAIGVFDGVHLGHQAILRRLVERARKVGGTSVVLTFDPHPQKVISPADAPLLLQTREQKQELLSQLGIEVVFQLPFTRRLSLLEPEEFVTGILLSHGIREIYVGENFRFGHRRAGDFEMLKHLGEGIGLKVFPVEPLLFRGRRISSTRIRGSLLRGRVSLARHLLGRPYRLEGSVICGDRRGVSLGFPTANLRLVNELIPETGVYATRSSVGRRSYLSVTNVGYRPTFHTVGGQPSVETHLLDFDRDVYGANLTVEFCFRIRGEKKFDNPDSLKNRIAKDISRARSVLPRGREQPSRREN